jgi:hypothetical protein
MEQTQTLKEFRNGYYFDSLEELLHRSNVLAVHDALFIKVTEAKMKGANVADNEKMLQMLNEAGTFYVALYSHLKKVEQENFDLKHLNLTLLRKNEALQNTINAMNL